MFVRVRRWTVVLACLALVAGADRVLAAVTSKQRAAINTLKRKAKQVERLCEEEKFSEAGEALGAIQKEYDALLTAAQEEKGLVPLLEPLYAMMLRPHARLELEGIDVTELKKPAAGDMPTGGTTSFRNDVAPILVAKCGRCHVNSARGMFSMATYAALMKGSEAGVVIFAKDDQGSRLIEMIESGDMPRGGLKVTPEELATLKAWIREGARYDAPDPQTRISTFAPNVTSDVPMLEVARPQGNETVSFANDLAPVLAATCAGCHGNGQQNAGQFSLATFESLLRGGDGGPPLAPGNPAESLIIRKLKGTASGQRMPRGLPPLADDVIAKFEKWIEEGATFDGGDAQANVVDVAALAKALRSTHEDLSRDRAELAQQNWRLGLPSVEADMTSTENFLLLGNVGEATLAEYGTKAEQVAPRVGELFKVPEDQPLIKGKMTLFVLRGRYDYSEFGKMIEQREIPQQWRGHWRFSTVDAYAALVPTKSDDFSNDVLLAQLIAGTYVASLGREVPRWFSEGAARAAASRLAPKDPRVAEWNEEVSGALGAMTAPHDFMIGNLSPEAADVAAYRFVAFLMSRDARRFQGLLRGLRSGQPFENAFLAAYRAPPAQIATAWLQYEAAQARRQ